MRFGLRMWHKICYLHSSLVVFLCQLVVGQGIQFLWFSRRIGSCRFCVSELKGKCGCRQVMMAGQRQLMWLDQLVQPHKEPLAPSKATVVAEEAAGKAPPTLCSHESAWARSSMVCVEESFMTYINGDESCSNSSNHCFLRQKTKSCELWCL